MGIMLAGVSREGMMKRAATWLATATAIALMGGFASFPAAAADEPLAIANQLVQKWVDALNKRDAAALDSALAAVYTVVDSLLGS